MLPYTNNPEISKAIERLNLWVEAENFRGWDPHDALNSPALRWIGKRQRLAGVVLVQILRRSPFNLRPLLGLPKGYNPKAMGLFLANYAQRFASTGTEGDLEKVRYFARWLLVHAATGYNGACWGYNFDWPNRAFLAPAGVPTVVNTAFIALAFLAADSILDLLPSTFSSASAPQGNDLFQKGFGISAARSACEFILHDLHVLRPKAGEICFSYTPTDHRFVHNANMLAAWLLAAVYSCTGEQHLHLAAEAAARFTVTKQRDDGSWSYGIADRDGWVDNFHTGYILVALARVARYLNTGEFELALERGYQFWKTRMFSSSVIPKYYPNRTYPIDIHCVAQAILTFLEFSDSDPEALILASNVCRWAIENLQDQKGFFHYQVLRWYRIKIPYMRWSQAWMQLAMTNLLCRSKALTWSCTSEVSN